MERFGSAPHRALQRDRGGEFVFHLNKDAADGRNAGCEALDDLGGGRDGIAGREARAGGESAFTTGVIAIEEMRAGKYASRISVHLTIRRAAEKHFHLLIGVEVERSRMP